MTKNENNINKFGLLNSLITLINEGEENSADVTIAKYLLQNFNQLKDLNIYDISAECYVSRATIRRMAQKLGFENFKDLKNQISNFSDYPIYRAGIDTDEFGNSVIQQIVTMANECEQFFNEEKIENIVQEINQASQIVFLTFDIYSRQSSEFQKAMILSGKMVRVISSKFVNNELLANLKKDDMLIVISISGYFASQVIPFIKEINTKKILLTTIHDDYYESIFDELWYLSSVPRIEKRSVYTMYGTQYCLERIFNAYIKKYKKIKN